MRIRITGRSRPDDDRDSPRNKHDEYTRAVKSLSHHASSHLHSSSLSSPLAQTRLAEVYLSRVAIHLCDKTQETCN